MSDSLLTHLNLSPADVAALPNKLRSQIISYLIRWQDYSAALECLEAADTSRYVSLQDMHAQALAALDRPAEAVDVMQRRVAQRYSHTAQMTLGRYLLQQGDSQAALEIVQAVLAAEDVPGYAWSNLGDVYLAQGELGQAEVAYLRHQQLNPGSRQPSFGLAQVYWRRGDPVTAAAYAVQAYTVAEEDRPLTTDLLHDLRDFFAQIGDHNRLAEADAILARRQEATIAELLTLLQQAGDTKQKPEKSRRSTRASPLPTRPTAPPLPNLATIPVSDAERTELETAVREHFGFPSLLPAQVEIMACARRGENVLAVLPTGGGKSLCYQLPALMDGNGITLVISPLIALMKDQVDSLPPLARARAIALNSSLDGSELREALVDMANGRYLLVYAAPERLRQPPFLYALRRAGVSRLVIDEAHCVSVWGHDFRPDYLYISQAHQALGAPPILAMTATAPPRVRQDIERRLFGRGEATGKAVTEELPASAAVASSLPPIEATGKAVTEELPASAAVASPLPPIEATGKAATEELPASAAVASPLRHIATDTYRPNLRLSTIAAANEDEKLQQLLRLCHGLEGSGIIYAGTRRRCEALAEMLRGQGIDAIHYHAGIFNRSEVQDAFMSGRTRIIVATIAFGMGVDKADIRFIIHYGLPNSVEAYYQEAGRAGRDGQPAHCILLYSNNDKGNLTRLANQSALTIDFLRRVYKVVRARLGAPPRTGDVPLDDLLRFLADDGAGRGLDETAVRVALSTLEQVGLLQRHADVPRTVTLQRLSQGEDARFDQFADQLRLRPWQEVTRNFADIMAALPATEVETQLLAWQASNFLAYEANGRNCLLTLLPPPRDVATRIESLLGQYAAIQQQRVAEIVAYARNGRCRHGYLSAYLGGAPRQQCDTCDNCHEVLLITDSDSHSGSPLSEEEQQRLILAALRESSWGRLNLVALLRGEKTANRQPLHERAQQSAVFGKLSFRSRNSLEKLVDNLIVAGYVEEVKLSHGGVALQLSLKGRKYVLT